MLPAVGGAAPTMSAASCPAWVEADGVLVGLIMAIMSACLVVVFLFIM